MGESEILGVTRARPGQIGAAVMVAAAATVMVAAAAVGRFSTPRPAPKLAVNAWWDWAGRQTHLPLPLSLAELRSPWSPTGAGQKIL